MPTLLTTRKMSPELAARVEAAVRGRRAAPGARITPRSVSLFRLGMITVIAIAAGWIAVLWHQTNQELERARAALLEGVKREAASLTSEDQATLGRVRSWLTRSSSAYAGDFIADELRVPAVFGETIARPMVYVRGALQSFRTTAGINENAAASATDAFVLCLLDPPASRTEKALLARVRTAYAVSNGMRGATLHVQRLAYAVVGLPFLAPEWTARVAAADDQRALDRLRRDFERAPLKPAKRAAKARLLLFAMDEPADRAGPTELDGERAHPVRVGVVDLAADKLLLRLRRRVDPSWLSAGVRAEYASGIDSCTLALDVREGVQAPVTLGGRE